MVMGSTITVTLMIILVTILIIIIQVTITHTGATLRLPKKLKKTPQPGL
jgi:hypothetical protein